jgi:hypothetical protein
MFGRSRRRFAVLAALSIATTGALATIGAGTAHAVQIDVTSNADTGVGTLRAAFAAAALAPGDDTIVVDPGISLIQLTTAIAVDTPSDADSVTVQGNVVTVEQTGANQGVLQWKGTDATDTLTLNQMTITGGNGATGFGVAVFNGKLSLDTVDVSNNHSTTLAFGGAYGDDALTIHNTNIHDNSSNGTGGLANILAGAGLSSGPIVVTSSTIEGNLAGNTSGTATSGSFGGLAGATLAITDSTIEGNQATTTVNATTATATGGFGSSGNATVSGSTITGNTATSVIGIASGGGGSAAGALTVTNSTITGNTATASGANTFAAAGGGGQTVVLTYVTAVNNTATSPTAGFSTTLGSFSTLNSFGSVLADTLGGGTNCIILGATTSSRNYSDDPNSTVSCKLGGTGDDIGGSNDPMLDPIGSNGGSTQTMLPQDGGPLIDAIPNASCAGGITTDQRGSERSSPPGGSCDVGAVEVLQAATFTVTNGNDSGAGSLRQAFLDAKNHVGEDNIVVDDSVSTISLTTFVGTPVGAPDLTGDVSVDGGDGVTVTQTAGSNQGVITWQGNGTSTLSLSNMAVTGGKGSFGWGVGVSAGNLSLSNVEVFGNHPTSNAGGGGVGSFGTLTIANSNIHDNTINGAGLSPHNGQIAGGAASVGAMTITDSTIRNNTAGVTTPGSAKNVGGAYSLGTLTVTDSTIKGNSGAGTGTSVNGGGAGADGQVTVTGATVEANSASAASGFAVGGVGSATADVVVTNSTIAGNTTSAGAALLQVVVGGTTAVTLKHATLAGNNTGGATIGSQGTINLFGSVIVGTTGGGINCFASGAITSNGYNFSDGATNSCNLTNTGDSYASGNAPLLGALDDNGGPTETMLPQTGSPLIDRVTPSASCDVSVTTDQRGIGRPQDFGCDTGAVEVEAVPITYNVTNGNDTGAGSLRQAFSDAAGHTGPDNILVQDSTNLITLTTMLSQPDTSGNVDVDGNGATVQRTGTGGVIFWQGNTGTTLALTDMTVRGGNGDMGAGVSVQGSLTLTNVEVTDNHMNGNTFAVGGAAATEALTITDSHIHGNSADGTGGAFNNLVGGAGSGGALTVVSSTIEDNTAGATGSASGGNTGGVGSFGAVSVTGSTIRNNSATGTTSPTPPQGRSTGGVSASTTLEIVDSTIAGNTGTGTGVAPATGGFNGGTQASVDGSTINGNTATTVDAGATAGGGSSGGSTALTNSTVTGNTATRTGSAPGLIFAIGGIGAGNGTVTLRHATVVENTAVNAQIGSTGGLNTFGSVIADPNGGTNCLSGAATTSTGFNWSDDANNSTSCKLNHANDSIGNTDPLLGTLGDNGGPNDDDGNVHTMLPGSGSPLINTIPVASCSTEVDGVDQRDVGRPQGNGCDRGAVEVRLPGAPTSAAATVVATGAAVSWTLAPSPDGRTGHTVVSSVHNKTCAAAANATSCTVTGLTPGTNYTFTVKANNAAGASPPSAPTNVVKLITKPDLIGGKTTSCANATTGNNLYAAAAPGTTLATANVKRGQFATFCLRFQNDGNYTYASKVLGTGSTANKFTVNYGTGTAGAATTNKTSAVVAGTHSIGNVAKTAFGPNIFLRVKVENGAPTSGATSTKTITITLTSTTNPAVKDNITIKVHATP